MESDITIKYSTKDAPTLKRFMDDRSFISFVMGPFGSGKSSACLMKIIKIAKEQAPGLDGIRRVRFAVVRNTYGQLKDTTIKTVLKWLPEEYFGTYNKTDHDYFITEIPGIYIELMFRALDRPDHVRNLLSLEVTGAWINEYREILREIFEPLQGRTGRYPAVDQGGCTWHGIIGDSNPPEEGDMESGLPYGGSYWWHFFEQENPDNAKLFKQPSGLSPQAENIKHLIPGYYFNLAKGKDKHYISVYCEGKYGFVADGEAITPEYNEDIHRSKDVLVPFPGTTGIRFWDGGHNPTCVIAQLHPVNGRLIVYNTIVGENIGMMQLINNHVKPLMATKFKKITQWIDSGDPSLETSDDSNTDFSPAGVINDLLNAEFIPGVKEWETRKQAIKYVLTSQPLLLLCKSEIRLHAALRGGWKFKKVNSGRGPVIQNEAVKDIHSHPADAISQGLPTIGIRIPEEVESSKKPKKERKSWLEA